jgi:hypothetical protein
MNEVAKILRKSCLRGRRRRDETEQFGDIYEVRQSPILRLPLWFVCEGRISLRWIGLDFPKQQRLCGSARQYGCAFSLAIV